MINLMDYIPDFLKDLREYKVLFSILNDEINNLDKKITRYKDNLYVETTDEIGIKEYEKIFDIYGTESLEFRRLRILNRYQTHYPFTEIWLREQLDFLLGKGNYKIELDYNNYILKLDVSISSSSILREFRHMLTIIRPCNLVIKLSELITEDFFIEDSHYAYLADKMLKFPDTFKDPFITWGGAIKI